MAGVYVTGYWFMVGLVLIVQTAPAEAASLPARVSILTARRPEDTSLRSSVMGEAVFFAAREKSSLHISLYLNLGFFITVSIIFLLSYR